MPWRYRGGIIVQIGEIYRVKPVFASEQLGGVYMKGKVVYIHPKRRHAALEFREQKTGNTVRECFWPEELTEENRRKR